MTISNTNITDVKLLSFKAFEDERGQFVKTLHVDTLAEFGINFATAESFYSNNNQNVIRGMHYHTLPNAHAKLICILQGRILDVALDIRLGSTTYGQYVTQILDAHTPQALYIPQGFAHGFATLSTQATVLYYQDGVYNAQADSGIHYNSFGFTWPIAEPIISQRDLSFNTLQQYTQLH
jgi:dTDP-4-dehydrorhamnose 3,5-epimerase